MIQRGPFLITLQNEITGSKEQTHEKMSLQVPVNLDFTFTFGCRRYTQNSSVAAVGV